MPKSPPTEVFSQAPAAGDTSGHTIPDPAVENSIVPDRSVLEDSQIMVLLESAIKAYPST